MISREPFDEFNRKRDVVSLFIIVDRKILLLKRQKGKSQEGKWGPPAGKVDDGETLEDAICRETIEETGIRLKLEELQRSRDVYYVKHGDIHFRFFVFSIKLNKRREVLIQPREHSEYKWVTPKEALKMPLIEDEEIPIRDFQF